MSSSSETREAQANLRTVLWIILGVFSVIVGFLIFTVDIHSRLWWAALPIGIILSVFLNYLKKAQKYFNPYLALGILLLLMVMGFGRRVPDDFTPFFGGLLWGFMLYQFAIILRSKEHSRFIRAWKMARVKPSELKKG